MTEQQTAVAAPQKAAPRLPSEPAASTPQRSRGRKLLPLLLALGVIATALIIWQSFFAGSGTPNSIVAVSGRIEGDDSAVAPKTAGRILEIRVREGDSVKAGDVIAVLDDAQVRAREDAARAALTAAQAGTKSAQDQVAVLEQQLQQNQLLAGQAKLDADGRVRQAEADVAAAQSVLAQQQAAYSLALFDKDAYTKLAASGAVSERQGKQAVATADQDAAAVAAAERRLAAAQGALTTAQANLANEGIRQTQVLAVQKQIAQQESEIATANANAKQAGAQLAETQADRQDLTVTAPFSGTVLTRAAEPGEVVQAGTAVITLLDLTMVYLRGFVPEGEIGKVAVGQPARIYLDSNPKQPVDAYVSRIDPEATFTPENTYFQNDRVKQVVGLKLQLKGAFGLAKPGMPADGEILVQGNSWPKEKR